MFVFSRRGALDLLNRDKFRCSKKIFWDAPRQNVLQAGRSSSGCSGTMRFWGASLHLDETFLYKITFYKRPRILGNEKQNSSNDAATAFMKDIALLSLKLEEFEIFFLIYF